MAVQSRRRIFSEVHRGLRTRARKSAIRSTNAGGTSSALSRVARVECGCPPGPFARALFLSRPRVGVRAHGAPLANRANRANRAHRALGAAVFAAALTATATVTVRARADEPPPATLRAHEY